MGADSAASGESADAGGKVKRSREEKRANAARKQAKLEHKQAEAAAQAGQSHGGMGSTEFAAEQLQEGKEGKRAKKELKSKKRGAALK